MDAMLDDVHQHNDDAAARRRAEHAIGHIAAHLEVGQQAQEFEGTTLLDNAREMFSTDYYLRQWGRLGMRNRSEQVDDFGLDPTYEARVQPLFELLYQRYFRVETVGLEHIPGSGRALLIGNHSGTIPFDGVMLKTAIGLHHPARRAMRWLAEDFVFHFPFLGAFMNRIGAVRACQENAQRLLAQESLLAVFPEGIQGIGKLYRERYRLQRFGRGGYIKLALRTGTPIVPVAIVGGEETYPLLLKLTKLAKPLGVPFVPVTPLFPWLGPVGLLPLPSRWRISVGAPIAELAEYGPADAEDPIVVNRLNERVRHAIQELLDSALTARGEGAFVARS
jgi:1-acyl-sn-glycerol-3-phosphate acyltransferase